MASDLYLPRAKHFTLGKEPTYPALLLYLTRELFYFCKTYVRVGHNCFPFFNVI